MLSYNWKCQFNWFLCKHEELMQIVTMKYIWSILIADLVWTFMYFGHFFWSLVFFFLSVCLWTHMNWLIYLHVCSVFLQLNPDVNVFQRKFVNEVRRCEEMERKLSKWAKMYFRYFNLLFRTSFISSKDVYPTKHPTSKVGTLCRFLWISSFLSAQDLLKKK